MDSTNTAPPSNFRSAIPGSTGQGWSLHYALSLLVLMLTLVPALGWAGWLLAALPGEHVPRSASLIGLMLSKLHQLPVWAAVAGLNMAVPYLFAGARNRVPRWLNAIPDLLLVVGLILFYVALGQTTAAGDQRQVEFTAAGCLLAAVLLTAGQVLWMLWGRPGGIELPHLFLATAVEWLLVFGSADLMLRLHFAGQTAVPPAARMKLFEIAQLGVLANLVFGVGLRAWPELFGILHLRPRACLLTLVLYNIGLILLVTGVQIISIIGGVTMLVGVLLFLVGLDFLRGNTGSSVWPSTDKLPVLHSGTTRIALLWLIVTLILLLSFCMTEGPSPGMGYDAFGQAIEHALVAGFFGTLVIGIAARLIPMYLPQNLVPAKMLTAIAWTFGLATLLRQGLTVSTIPVIAPYLGIDLSVPFVTSCQLDGMAACAAGQCAAIILLGLVILRTAVVARRG